MKKIILMLALLFSFNGWAEETPLNGYHETFYENGQLKTRDNYKNGKVNGLSEAFYENGKLLITANYKDGKLHGLFETFFSDEEITSSLTSSYLNLRQKKQLAKGLKIISSKGNYVDDQQDGLWGTYHITGELSSLGEYKKGKAINDWKFYDLDGDLLGIGRFDYGEEERPGHAYFIDPKGNIIMIAKVNNGSLTGPYEKFNEKGVITNQGTLLDGYNHGSFETLHENGLPEIKGTYEFGKKVERWEVFDQEGNLRAYGDYIDDQKDGIWNYYKTPLSGNKLGTNIATGFLTRNLNIIQSTILNNLITIDRKEYFLMGKEVRRNKYFKERPDERPIESEEEDSKKNR